MKHRILSVTLSNFTGQIEFTAYLSLHGVTLMTQDDINQAEWNKPGNWSCGLYFSKKDNRVWVPKRIKSLGWTLNLGQRKGAIWLISIVIGAIAFVVVSNIVAINLIKK
jgi:uncharacterized membrane protein